LPNASRYLDIAQEAGISTDAIGSVADLNSAMSELGVSPSQASQLVSNVGDYVGKAGPAFRYPWGRILTAMDCSPAALSSGAAI
jgi:hypothetical protein